MTGNGLRSSILISMVASHTDSVPLRRRRFELLTTVGLVGPIRGPEIGHCDTPLGPSTIDGQWLPPERT